MKLMKLVYYTTGVSDEKRNVTLVRSDGRCCFQILGVSNCFKSWESEETEEAAFKFQEGAGINEGLVLRMKVEEEAVEAS